MVAPPPLCHLDWSAAQWRDLCVDALSWKGKKEAAGTHVFLRSDGFVQRGLSLPVSIVSMMLSHGATAGSLDGQDRVVGGSVVAVALNGNLLVGTA